MAAMSTRYDQQHRTQFQRRNKYVASDRPCVFVVYENMMIDQVEEAVHGKVPVHHPEVSLAGVVDKAMVFVFNRLCEKLHNDLFAIDMIFHHRGLWI